MRKTAPCAVLLAAFSCGLAAQSISSVAYDLVAEMGRAWLEKNPGAPMKPTVALLPFMDGSERAKAHGVSTAFRDAVTNALALSTAFVQVDRDNLPAVLEQLELSLSGATEGTRLEFGAILDVEYLLAGSVVEDGDSFSLSVKLISVKSSAVEFAKSRSLPLERVIADADAFKAYVFQYGLGIEFAVNQIGWMDNPMSRREGQNVGEPIMTITALFRPLSWLVVSVGFEAPLTQLRLAPPGSEYGNVEVPVAEIGSMDTTGWTATGVSYRAERVWLGLLASVGVVIEPLKELNLTLGAAFIMNAGQIRMMYSSVPDPDGSGTSVDFQVVARCGETLDIQPFLKVQWFIAPRLAINVIYEYRWQTVSLSSAADDFVEYSLGPYSGNSFAFMWNLDPSVDAWGNPLLFDLTGHRLTFGIGIYF